jgi:L-alanine-DL-glutamate epimerase-like enolase superfamily enzyme
MTIDEIKLHRLSVPLYKPYNSSLAKITALDSIVGEVQDSEGRCGFGETTVITGYTHETVDGAWAFLREHGARIVGGEISAAKESFDPYRESEPHAVSVLQVALEMLESNAILDPPDEEMRVPILAPVNSKDHGEIPDEIEALLEQGFDTLKVKVGWNVDQDLERLRLIQRTNAGRATLRLDANQGFTRSQALRFTGALDTDSIQLFEQPCDADDWDSNAAVAASSPVPVMMDESIYGFRDIERAGAMKGCGFVKLKISKSSGVDLLTEGLQRIASLGMGAILGNGAATDIGCWVEACVARAATPHAGEMHGFLKNREQLLREPLVFDGGAIVLRSGYVPALDQAALARLTVRSERFATTRTAVAAESG